MDSPTTIEMDSIITLLPGGEKLLWGGTRRNVKLSRPVEAGVLFDPSKTKCPYHRAEEASLAEYFGGEIRVMKNLFTPHRNHKLVIPRECTNEKFVRTLGGREFIERCLHVIADETAKSGDESVFAVHVLRGQNVPHLHWHVYNYWPGEGLNLDREAKWANSEAEQNVIIETTGNFQVIVRGPLTGQMMIIPRSGASTFLHACEHELSGALHRLITLTNTAFTSTQGELPRYTLAGRCDKEGRFRYLLYTPDLQVRGCPDDLADLNGTARTRAWSPLETAEHLRKFS